MAAVNMNMFDANVGMDKPTATRGASLMVLPLNLIALIVSQLDDAADLARLCRTCRVLNYMALPQLYRDLTLTSYDKIRYRGDEPEGLGSASPFSMGLNAVITRPYATLVRSMTLRGEWREHELEEHARVGRVPDSSMMLNIAVRAAVDKMTELESFSWELNTKMLEPVYTGLSQLPRLTSLTLRFPSSRHPRPTTVIPAMPHLRCLKLTDIDPLCYPDDISTLLACSKKLRELKMHWSPRMRNAQEPSVMLHDYFRKCIATKQPMKIRKIALQNLYALHSEEFMLAIDQSCIEDVAILTNPGEDFHPMNTFVDNSWPATPPVNKGFRFKSMRHDILSKRHCDFLSHFTGLERLYFVNPNRDPNDQINTPRNSTESSSNVLTPPAVENPTSSTSNGPSSSGGLATANSPAAGSPPSTMNLHLSLRDSYLNIVLTNHATTLRHLLLPSRWPLSAATIARLVHTCPQLEQLALATELSSIETLGLLLPFLRKLVALRLLIPTNTPPQSTTEAPPRQPARPGTGPQPSSLASFASVRTLADLVDLDEDFLTNKLSIALADEKVYGNLKIVGMGWKAWELREFYSAPPQQPAAATTNGDGPQKTLSSSSSSSSSSSPSPSPSSAGDPAQGSETMPEAAVLPTTTTTTTGAGAGPLTTMRGIKTPISRGSPQVAAAAAAAAAAAQQPASSLGKRTRDSETASSADQRARRPGSNPPGDNPFDECVPITLSAEARLRRRRLRRVGWDVLKHWEIWSLDTQEI